MSKNRHSQATGPSVAKPSVAKSRGSVLPTSARTQVAAAGIVEVSGPSEAQKLAGRLLDPERDRPIVVISVPGGRAEPWIDAAEIESAVRSLAEVVVLVNDAASWRLSALLPEKAQVYGGAGRVYPVGTEWQADPYVSPLHFAYGEGDGARVTESLIHDALEMAARASAGAAPAQAPGVPTRRVRGVVRQLVPPSRALVQLDDDCIATIWSELTAPGVTIDRLVTPGHVVTGMFDADARRLDVSEMRQQPDVGADAYPVGAVVLAAVASVRPDIVHLALTPNHVVPVPKDRVTANPLDRMTSLFTEGETVLARVAWRDGDRIFLRLDDIDDGDEPLPTPALLAGGPPWLLPPPEEEENEEEDEIRSTASDVPARQAAEPVRADAARGQRPPTPRDLAAEREAADATTQARAFRERARELEALVHHLQEKVRHQKTALRRAKQRRQGEARGRATNVDPAGGPEFSDPVDQFRHEVYLEWVRRIPASQKAEMPLGAYSLGSEFLDTLCSIEGVSRSKVVQVVVEVLTGLADTLDSRDKHQLRASASGGSPAVTREGGWVSWRVALQRETPAARRLHFWQRGREYELSRVGNHDDLRP